MASIQPHEWHHTVDRKPYTISSSRDLLDLPFINASFASGDMYWAKALPLESLKLMFDNSLTLGLYKGAPGIRPATTASSPSSPRTPSPTLAGTESHSELNQIGMARFNTDYVTFAYLTDVYVEPSYRGTGLGHWLIKCCKEVLDDMPHLRRAALMATPGVGTSYYGKALGFHDVGEERERVVLMTLRGPGSGMGSHSS